MIPVLYQTSLEQINKFVDENIEFSPCAFKMPGDLSEKEIIL